MKKLRLNPLGELSHRLGMGWLMMGLMTALCLGACSDDDDNVAATFPAKQTFNCDANEIKELTFPANASWTLTSSELWCRFVVDGVEEYSLSGGAGQQKVTLKITDEAQKTDAKSVAHITLAFGSESAIVAEVVRNAKGFEFAITDEEGNPVDVITVEDDNYAKYNFSANFRFAATNRPDWIQIEGGAIVGSSNETVASRLRFSANEDKRFAIGEDAGYTITFADEAGAWTKTVPVVYIGMNPLDIEIEGPDYFNWEVSLDGKTFSQTGSSGMDGTATSATYNKFVPFKITAPENKFVTVCLEDWNGDFYDDVYDVRLSNPEADGMVKLTVGEAYDERTIHVLVFSEAEYDQIKNDLVGNLVDENGEIVYRYTQNNLLMSFVQKEKKEQGGAEDAGFEVKLWGYQDLDVEKVTDTAILEEVMGCEFYNLPDGKVYSVRVDPGAYISINPKLDASEWNSIEEIGGVKTIGIGYDELWGEPGQDYSTGEATIAYSFPEVMESNCYIGFYDDMKNFKKVLVVIPNN